MRIEPILTVLLVGATLGTAQDAARRAGGNLNPCPFGVISIGEIDAVVVPRLEELPRISDPSCGRHRAHLNAGVPSLSQHGHLRRDRFGCLRDGTPLGNHTSQQQHRSSESDGR